MDEADLHALVHAGEGKVVGNEGAESANGNGQEEEEEGEEEGLCKGGARTPPPSLPLSLSWRGKRRSKDQALDLC